MLDQNILYFHAKLRELPIISSIMLQLRSDLPKYLQYHSYSHTEEVLYEAMRFACIDKIPSRSIEIIGIAAAFHDAGFLQSTTLNEPIGSDMAASAMSTTGSYSSEEIGLVKQMILDTALINVAAGFERRVSTDLSPYLLDADLSNLGRDDFFHKGELQRVEISAEELPFWRVARKLLRGHIWHTPAAKALRTWKQQSNLAALEKRLEDLGD